MAPVCKKVSRQQDPHRGNGASGLSILQVVTDTDRRGAQTFAVQLHGALTDLAQHVETVALAPGTVGGLDLGILGSTRRSVRTLLALRRLAKNFDVVVAHGSTTLFACATALRLSNTPFVYRQISDPEYWAPRASAKLRVNLFLRRASHVVALWDGAVDQLRRHFGVDPAKISVIPNAVPSKHFPAPGPDGRGAARASLGLPPTAPIVLYLGALASEKSVDTAVRAVSQIAGAFLLVVGDGPQRLELKRLAESLLPGRHLFTGRMNDPTPALTAADAMVMPSSGGDSMPAVLIEAALSEIPAVTSDYQAMPVVVIDGVTGAVVPAGDAAAVHSALARYMSDKDRREAHGRAARKHALERFDMELVARQWLSVLRLHARARRVGLRGGA